MNVNSESYLCVYWGLPLNESASTSAPHGLPTNTAEEVLHPASVGSLGLVGGFFDWFGSLGVFAWQVLRSAVTPPFELRELVRQLDDVGSKSLPLVALAGSSIGRAFSTS